MGMTENDWDRLTEARDALIEAGMPLLAELVWDQTPKWASYEDLTTEAMRVTILVAREQIMHLYLDALEAPTHDDGYKLNINGRMYDYLLAHPELVTRGNLFEF